MKPKIYVSRTNALCEDFFIESIRYLESISPHAQIVWYDKGNDYNGNHEKNKRRGVTHHIVVVENSNLPLGRGVYLEHNEEFKHLTSKLLYKTKSRINFQFYNFHLILNTVQSYTNYCNIDFGFNCTSEVLNDLYVDSSKNIEKSKIPISRIRFIYNYYKYLEL